MSQALPTNAIPRVPGTRLPFLVEIWIVLAAFLQCLGWLLSWFHQLNAAAYAIALGIGAGFLWWRRSYFDLGHVRFRRFRRIFPRCFLTLALLATLGGILHAPGNYDGLAYRIPRVLRWLAQDQWHWIHTSFHRLNVRATGWEWLAAPMLALAHSYRWLFLINALSYCLMPGLVFSVFTRLGVRPLVAWHWMWLMPAGLCFLLQAGSIANDAIGAIYALAAVDFALRARQSRKISDLWLSALSAALLSSSKTVNLPLLLPWLIAILPVLGLMRKQIMATAAVMIFTAGASLLPMAILNQKYCGDWTALSAEQASPPRGGPLLFIPINAVALSVQNLAPPIFPMANAWNAAIEKRLPKPLTNRLEGNFERPTAFFTLGQMEIEEGAGLGLGISVLLFLSFGFALVSKKIPLPRLPDPQVGLYRACLLLAPWGALLFFMDKCTVGDQSRLVAAYYPLLIPALLRSPLQSRFVRSRWWRITALAAFALGLLPLIGSPPRPLWPALTVLKKLDAAHSSNGLLRRANDVYSVYAGRWDGFAPVRAELPAGLRVLGMVTWDDPEASLWLPIGSRRIEHIMPGDQLADLKKKGVEYVLVNPVILTQHFSQSLEEWETSMRAQPVKTIPLTLRAHSGTTDWFLVRLPKDGS